MKSLFRITMTGFLTMMIAFSVQAGKIKSGTIVRTCGDGAGWPPYTYFKRVDGEKTKEIMGYDVDVLNAIGAKHGITFTVSMPPWKRCLQQTQKGKRFQIALSASYSQERDKTYLMTRRYYTTTAHYFYSKKTYPDGLILTNREAFIKYKLCGLYGYNYEGFGISNDQLDQGAMTLPAVIKKTHQGRCDLFFERYEILAGFSTIGEKYLDETLGHAPVPGKIADDFYMLISRKYEHRQNLKKILDAGFIELERTDQLRQILAKHMP